MGQENNEVHISSVVVQDNQDRAIHCFEQSGSACA